MTLAEYSKRLDEVLRYVGRLLTAPEGSPEWSVGRAFVMTPDADRLGLVDRLVTDHGEKSREHEIGWDLQAIMRGWPDGGAAA
jgi:hypothetical protein